MNMCKGRKEREMNKKLAELTVNRSADYNDKVIKALEDAGFLIIIVGETITESKYIVAERVTNDM
jgi:G:T-mismatch repair DNA endonuclease (very short patch repair protein)